MHKPHPLVHGSSVALVNPGGSLPERYGKQLPDCLEFLEREGLKPKAALGSGKDNVERFNAAGRDSEIKALLPFGTGKYDHDCLDGIDYEALKRNAPLIATYSSGSPFLLRIHQESRLISFYGPHVAFLQSKSSMRENAFTIASFLNMLCAKGRGRGLGSTMRQEIFRYREPLVLPNLFSRRPDFEHIPFIGYDGGDAGGKLIAGSIEGFLELAAQDFDVDFTGRIVMMDSMGIGLDDAFSKVHSLLENPTIREAAAVYIGSLTNRLTQDRSLEFPELCCGESLEDFVDALRRSFTCPVLYGFPMGHSRHKLTIPLGVDARVDLHSGDISLLESPLYLN